MEFRQLKYFEAVAKSLNFSEAARRLFVSQSALSQQIKLLEEELGVRLLERDSHGVTLTEEGEMLLPMVSRALRDLVSCRQQVRDMKNSLTGDLSVGITFSFRDITTDAISTFLRYYPGVKLHIYYKTSSELGDMLRDGALDFLLAFKSSRMHDDLECEQLFEYDLSVVMGAGHPLAGRPSLAMKDIVGYPIALPGSGTQARKAFDRFVNVDTSELDVRAEINDPNVILDLVSSSDMLSILSGQVVRYRSNMVAVPLQGMDGVRMRCCVYMLKGAYRKKSAMAFIDILRDSEKIRQLIH